MLLKMHCVLCSSGFYPTGRNCTRGWITDFLEGASIYGPLVEHEDFSTGLVTVPLVLNHPSGAQDTAALVAGMLGFTVHRTDTSDDVTVQPFQGWTLMLAKDSPFLSRFASIRSCLCFWFSLRHKPSVTHDWSTVLQVWAEILFIALDFKSRCL